MVARTPTSLKGADIQVGYWDVNEVQMSTNDTVTLPDYSASAGLVSVMVVKKSDMTTVTASYLNNVVTLTQAGLTNINLIIFVAGVKAS